MVFLDDKLESIVEHEFMGTFGGAELSKGDQQAKGEQASELAQD